MLSNRKVLAIVSALVTIVVSGISGCAKDTTVIIDNPPAITKTVSFSKDIVPILNQSCSISGCHNSGGHVPDLTQDKAYVSLKDGNYINTGIPENSEVYLWLTGKRATGMPMGAPKDPSSINELVLAWIKQGAKKN